MSNFQYLQSAQNTNTTVHSGPFSSNSSRTPSGGRNPEQKRKLHLIRFWILYFRTGFLQLQTSSQYGQKIPVSSLSQNYFPVVPTCLCVCVCVWFCVSVSVLKFQLHHCIVSGLLSWRASALNLPCVTPQTPSGLGIICYQAGGPARFRETPPAAASYPTLCNTIL